MIRLTGRARSAAQCGGTEPGLAQLGAQRVTVGAERGHRRARSSAGGVDSSICPPGSSVTGLPEGIGRNPSARARDLVPARPSLGTDQVDEVELQLEPDASAVVGDQRGLGDVLARRLERVCGGEQHVIGRIVHARVRKGVGQLLSGHPPLQVRTGCRGSRGSVRGDRQAVLVVLQSRLAHGTDKPNPAPLASTLRPR